MPRSLILTAPAVAALALCALPVSAPAAIWPEQLWEHKRTALKTPDLSDKPVWAELGLEAAEEAQYGGWKGVGYRLKDPTSAFVVYQWLKPAGAQPSPLEKYAVQTANRAFLLKGNYVLDFVGRLPVQHEVDILHVQLPRLDQSALPTLPMFLPAGNRVPGSERYIIGPAGLAKFEPRVSPSVAGFSMGAEAIVARYQTPQGEANLSLFYYPTPQIARERLPEFQKLPGVLAKRTGPMVALTISAPNGDEAEKLLAKVDYQATLTLNEKPPKPEPSAAVLLLGIFMNIGLLLCGAVLSGLAYGGIRIGWRKLRGRTEEDDAMLTLHLGEK